MSGPLVNGVLKGASCFVAKEVPLKIPRLQNFRSELRAATGPMYREGGPPLCAGVSFEYNHQLLKGRAEFTPKDYTLFLDAPHRRELVARQLLQNAPVYLECPERPFDPDLSEEQREGGVYIDIRGILAERMLAYMEGERIEVNREQLRIALVDGYFEHMRREILHEHGRTPLSQLIPLVLTRDRYSRAMETIAVAYQDVPPHHLGAEITRREHQQDVQQQLEATRRKERSVQESIDRILTEDFRWYMHEHGHEKGITLDPGDYIDEMRCRVEEIASIRR